MCLAVPMKLIERDTMHGVVSSSGIKVRVVLTLVPEANIGDYLLIHAGYALTILSEDDASQTIAELNELGVSIE